MISFDWPQMFWLLPLPLLVYFLVPAKKQSVSAIFMPQLFKRGINQSETAAGGQSITKLILLSLCWLLLMIAAAKPVNIGDVVELPNSGRDMFLAIDLSGSMQERDMEVNGREVDRLTLVKHVLKNFIEKREGDRLGLIVFGSNAYIQAPLTFDLQTVNTLLNESQIGFAGESTAIGNAIGLGIKRLADNPADSRILILLTDGRNTAGDVDPMQAAKLAKQESVIIYTIGIGSNKKRGGILGFGGQSASRDLDEKSLTEIAQLSGGQYFRARNEKELNNIYEQIDKLEQIEKDPEKLRPREDVFYWPLAAFMLLFLLHNFVSLMPPLPAIFTLKTGGKNND